MSSEDTEHRVAPGSHYQGQLGTSGRHLKAQIHQQILLDLASEYIQDLIISTQFSVTSSLGQYHPLLQ